MTSMIRLGVAAAALAFTSAARPCDVRGYDPATDRPRDGACPMIVRYVPPDATDYDTLAYSYAAMNDEAAGSGSGEPEATDPSDNHPSEDEFLVAVWTAP